MRKYINIYITLYNIMVRFIETKLQNMIRQVFNYATEATGSIVKEPVLGVAIGSAGTGTVATETSSAAAACDDNYTQILKNTVTGTAGSATGCVAGSSLDLCVF